MAQRAKSRKKNDKTPTSGIADLIKELWQAAVDLRGNIGPADYKRYVPPIIFLRLEEVGDAL